jgi:hypothetical protein
MYIFGKGREISIVYAEETLREETKLLGIKVEQLPPQEEREGYNAILCLDDTNKPYWEYIPIEKGTDEE